MKKKKKKPTKAAMAEAERVIAQLIAEGKVVRDDAGRLFAVVPADEQH